MPISDWFKAREERRYSVPSGQPAEGASDVPDGVWVKCESCKKTAYKGDFDENLQVCPLCGHHDAVGARDRIDLLADEGSFVETNAGMTSVDAIGFGSEKPYADKLASAMEKTGLPEAVVTGSATIGGHPVALGAMDFGFVGASMGSVVGEKVARLFELALAEKRPVVLVTASGGARMQEGMLSLMQMAKTSAAVARHHETGMPYIAVLTDPTMGGVTASFATLADVLLAEPGARIGFAGPALVEQTIRKPLPKGFQTAEFMLAHGMIDEIVDRRELRDAIALLLEYLAPSGGGAS